MPEEHHLRQLKLFLDFYFAPWGAAKSEVWESFTSYPFSPEHAHKMARDILDGVPGLSDEEERFMKIIVG